jgi:hypothetical protein
MNFCEKKIIKKYAVISHLSAMTQSMKLKQ